MYPKAKSAARTGCPPFLCWAALNHTRLLNRITSVSLHSKITKHKIVIAKRHVPYLNVKANYKHRLFITLLKTNILKYSMILIFNYKSFDVP